MSYPVIVNPNAIIAPYVALATSAFDVVGVFDSDFNQVFPDARPLRALIKPDKKLMEHPLETGATVTDFEIQLPVEIELYVVLRPRDFANTYQEIIQYYENGATFNVQTKVSTFSNMTIQSPPHEETSEVANTVMMVLKFKQINFANTIANTISPVSASDTNTVARGQQSGTQATPQQSEKVSLLYKAIGGIF